MPKIDFIMDKFPNRIYNHDKNTNLYKLLNSISIEFDELITKLDEVEKSKYIDYASGYDLDRLGSLLNVNRIINENDTSYRGRIKSKISSFIGGGTIDAIKQVIVQFLGVEPMIIEHYAPGSGHASFDNGVFNGLQTTTDSGMIIKISKGISYINGSKITSNEVTLNLNEYTSNRIDYIYMRNDGTFYSTTSDTPQKDEIPISKINITSNSISQSDIEDIRFILDPFEHSITNVASITVQIPFDFEESLISVNDVKDILKKTRAGGVALLIKIVKTFREEITFGEFIDLNFIVSFSGVGGANLINYINTDKKLGSN